jgi:hypothetical protein
MIGRTEPVKTWELVRWAREQAVACELRLLEAHVLLLLSTYANSECISWPSVKTLALQCGLKPTASGRNSAVSAALHRLQELQLIWTTQAGRGRTSRRELLFNPQAQPSAEQDGRGPIPSALADGSTNGAGPLPSAPTDPAVRPDGPEEPEEQNSRNSQKRTPKTAIRSHGRLSRPGSRTGEIRGIADVLAGQGFGTSPGCESVLASAPTLEHKQRRKRKNRLRRIDVALPERPEVAA